MRRALPFLLLASVLLPSAAAPAQMHKVEKPQQVVRAVGVYEWTGDLKKPTGSRLVPVTVFIDGALQDAGVYLARPVPFALTAGNEYILQRAGVDHGSLDLTFARHLQTANDDYEDGWLGYGTYKAPPIPKKEPVLRASKTQPAISSSKDDARPHFAGQQPSSTDKTDQTAGGTQSPQSSNPDADRPTMRRRGGDASSTTSGTDTPANPADDPDRPTLRRRSPDDAKKSKPATDIATVTGTGKSLNDDPDRPKLQRGTRSSANDSDLPKLVGTPKDLQQMVAVSDPANRPVHDFARSWESEAEHASVLAGMQALARSQIAAYAATQGPAPTAPAPATTAPHASRLQSTPTRSARAHGSSARRTAKPIPPSQPLLDEQLKAYILSYGGAPTYVYTAHTAGTGADLRYVTVVAQADVNGQLQPAVRSVTDEIHLDRTPQMRFVDVVDAEASNRASLLFELRSHSDRQFALYQVIGSRAQTLFTTGTTQ